MNGSEEASEAVFPSSTFEGEGLKGLCPLYPLDKESSFTPTAHPSVQMSRRLFI